MASAVIRHPIYDEADRLLRSHLTFAQDSTIIVITGPSKSGKSTLMRNLYKDHRPVGDQIPMIMTDAATRTDQHAMTDLIKRYLRELRHPSYVIDSLEQWKARKNPKRHGGEDARALLEIGLVLRQCMCIALDEGQQLVSATTKDRAFQAVESFKCLLHLMPDDSSQTYDYGDGNAQAMRRIGILSGGYKMLDEDMIKAHFGNRIAPIHVPRYRDTQSDRDSYASALVSLNVILTPFMGKGQTILEFEVLLYHGSFGCFGATCNWIALAIGAKEAAGSKKLMEEHFLKTKISLQMEASLAEIVAGEARYKELTRKFISEMHQALSDHEIDNGFHENHEEISEKRKRPKRAPHRYSTGP